MSTQQTRSRLRHLTVLGVALATGTTGSVVVATGASAGGHPQTLRFTTTQIEDVITGNADVAAGRDQQGGRTTGYDVTSCLIDVKTYVAHCDVAVARGDGLLGGKATIDLATGRGSGTVVTGTRAYSGARGTISVTRGPGPDHNTVTITYRT